MSDGTFNDDPEMTTALAERLRLVIESDCWTGSTVDLVLPMAKEIRRLRAENAALRAKITTRARAELKRFLGDLSEECYCAGWLTDWEFMIWAAMLRRESTGTDQPCGQYVVRAMDFNRMRELSTDAGGWIVWRDDTEETFVPMDEWLAMYAEHQAKLAARNTD